MWQHMPHAGRIWAGPALATETPIGYPRPMATIRYRDDRGHWEVRWTELRVTRLPDGTEERRWADRRRGAPSKRVAEQLARDVEAQLAVAGAWAPAAVVATRSIADLIEGYVTAMVSSGEPATTSSTRASLLATFESAHGSLPVSELGLGLLRDYAAVLPREGRQAATRHRKLLEIERAWAWAWRVRSEWPGLREPEQITGPLGEVRAPPPVVASAAATWEELDRMISRLALPWHRRVALLLRYTGLRASQALTLTWADVDLGRRLLRVRTHVRGAKRGRGRVLPMHPALVEEVSSWEPGAGLVFPRRYKKDGVARVEPYRGDVLVEPFRAAWSAAGVPADRWDVVDPDERGHGSPTHAIRRVLRTELLRDGHEEAVVLYLVGQSQGVTAAAYVPEDCPEQSPWWPRILRAANAVPRHNTCHLRVVVGE